MEQEVTIEDKIKEMHGNDEPQVSFIFSDSPRIIVEAPAGYGKTKTMISKIAYQLASNKIPSPKRILALTFSVNAAYKIKKDITEQIPLILNEQGGKKYETGSKIIVSNYHGLCRRILKRYGHKLHPNLRNLDSFTTFDDSRGKTFTDLGINLDLDSINFMNAFNQELKNANSTYLKANFDAYNAVLLEKIIPQNFIPFNALLSLTISLLRTNGNIQKFYQKFFPCIYIDEFQDTNIFSFGLIRQLVSPDTHLFFMGDSLQRIYGFIGALPNLINTAKNEFNMEYLAFTQNYRFKDNPQMLLLDYNIRRNAESLIAPNIEKDVEIGVSISDNQDEEAKYVFGLCTTLLAEGTDKVAILFRGGGGNNNTKRIIEEFETNQYPFFYGLFSDEDLPYRQFHLVAASTFSKLIGQKSLTRKLCRSLLSELKKNHSKKSPLHDSLLVLTEIFLGRIYSAYQFLSEEEKIILIKETFEGFGLKQYMEYVDSKLVLSTIHGAKGLEWSYVIMPDMEQSSLPHWVGTCEFCNFKQSCDVKYDTTNESLYLDELSVFYVGFTRARKQVYFSASKERLTSNGISRGCNLSCFFKLKGISIS